MSPRHRWVPGTKKTLLKALNYATKKPWTNQQIWKIKNINWNSRKQIVSEMLRQPFGWRAGCWGRGDPRSSLIIIHGAVKNGSTTARPESVPSRTALERIFRTRFCYFSGFLVFFFKLLRVVYSLQISLRAPSTLRYSGVPRGHVKIDSWDSVPNVTKSIFYGRTYVAYKRYFSYVVP